MGQRRTGCVIVAKNPAPPPLPAAPGTDGFSPNERERFQELDVLADVAGVESEGLANDGRRNNPIPPIAREDEMFVDAVLPVGEEGSDAYQVFALIRA